MVDNSINEKERLAEKNHVDDPLRDRVSLKIHVRR